MNTQVAKKNRETRAESLIGHLARLPVGGRWSTSELIQSTVVSPEALSAALRTMRNRVSPMLTRLRSSKGYEHLNYATHTAHALATNGDAVVTLIVERTADVDDL